MYTSQLRAHSFHKSQVLLQCRLTYWSPLGAAVERATGTLIRARLRYALNVSRPFTLWHTVLGVVIDGLAQQRLECSNVNFVVRININRAPLLSTQARVEELIRIRDLGSLMNVSFTLSLKASAAAYIPSCDQKGVPMYFQSSTTSGSTSWIILRSRAKVSPLQSSKSAIFLSIRLEASSRSIDRAALCATPRVADVLFATFTDLALSM